MNYCVNSLAALRSARLTPLNFAIAATIAVSALFMLLPSLDIATSGLFYSHDIGFVTGRLAGYRLLRSAGLLSINIGVGLALVAVLVRCLVPAQWQPPFLKRIRPRAVLFLAGTAALGPGLITNLILKDHWGRSRPIDLSLFGGTHEFSLPWIISDQCTRNCSFVSGEGSGAIWLLAFAFVVPKQSRKPVAGIALVWAAIISLNRIAFGGHFLSDVIIGWGLMLIVIFAMHDLILIRFGDRLDAAIGAWIARISPSTASN